MAEKSCALGKGEHFLLKNKGEIKFIFETDPHYQTASEDLGKKASSLEVSKAGLSGVWGGLGWWRVWPVAGDGIR